VAVGPAARLWGYVDPADTGAWLRHLDYYVHHPPLADQSLGTVLSALEASGAWDDTVIIFTSDHGDHVRSHGCAQGAVRLRRDHAGALYVKVPGVTSPGSVTVVPGPMWTWPHHSAALGGVDPAVSEPRCRVRPDPAWPTVDLGPGPTSCSPRTRPRPPSSTGALRPPGLLRRRHQYARYYGGRRKALYRPVGQVAAASSSTSTAPSTTTTHEWYDHDSIPMSWSPGQRPGPPLGAARRLRADASLRAGVVVTFGLGGSLPVPPAARPAHAGCSTGGDCDTPSRIRSRRI